ncbi:MAG: 50S ribosomal protein L6 [Candidatus Brocadiae bacterium]|nr:50S ribosomal protein L6 [Candidatus Brocadiia bacterium]
MSRIGNLPVPLPPGVSAELKGSTLIVSGPLGKLEQAIVPSIRLTLAAGGKEIRVERSDDERQTKALHGLMRNLAANMTLGVSQGYVKTLQIVGVGYGAKVQGKNIVVSVGFSHSVTLPIPAGLTVDDPESSSMLIGGVGAVPCTTVRIRGIDKQSVGEFAATIRRLRPPEPYKTKGVRYEGEEIRRKAGKAFAAQE